MSRFDLIHQSYCCADDLDWKAMPGINLRYSPPDADPYSPPPVTNNLSARPRSTR